MLARHHGFEQLNVVAAKRVERPHSTAGGRMLACRDVVKLPEARRSVFHDGGLTVRQQHDLADNSPFTQHLMRAARLLERQPSRDQGLDLALFEQIQQR